MGDQYLAPHDGERIWWKSPEKFAKICRKAAYSYHAQIRPGTTLFTARPRLHMMEREGWMNIFNEVAQVRCAWIALDQEISVISTPSECC